MDEWQQNLDSVNISKEDLNWLVLNFLIIEGYKDTAEKFAKESCTKSDIDLESIGDRMQIRSAVHHGNIANAIERVNDLDPEILETNDFVITCLRESFMSVFQCFVLCITVEQHKERKLELMTVQ
eukprot:746983-Hanusia_phi.AAC.1